MIDIAIATCSYHPDLGPLDRGVIAELAELGIRATPLIWTDAKASLDPFAAVVVQSTWDSHLDPQAFVTWARRVHAQTALFNPLHLLEWNLNKRYLLELEQQGIPITPTLWVSAGSSVDLRNEVTARGWTRFVIKPVVSAGATETHVFDVAGIETAQATFDRLVARLDLMIQPYLLAFETEGERSYIFFDGVFSHAVRRPPTLKSAPRGFDQSHEMPPIEAELQLSRQVLAKIGETPVYARVDLATNNDGVVRLQEVELVEPCLFTSLAPGAQQRYARAIARRLPNAPK
ncbi:hypothetical protein GCM10011487_14670 [Steroidobacter agaridevorans]|uniref:ATP-grasp domain-containing protein n=1 Tax=Steroidobacter agaridevorans TaxID=2695856 RepID=A0A829Y860_9GAMM|nr:hypothetical protein [Steroidobacter agaridevorans]GFE79467.1 hypothetical protein GCM10011487_14670 [Steroidobacter agaridevorans]